MQQEVSVCAACSMFASVFIYFTAEDKTILIHKRGRRWIELAKDIDKEMAKSIGIKLMLARDNAGLTREQLSENADVEANSIYRYETGKQVPNFPTVIRLAKGLGVSVADLVPDDYIAKTEDDPDGVVELFYQLDKQDQQAMLRQMMALVMLKKVS